MRFRRILVGTDVPTDADVAVEQAIRIARRQDASILFGRRLAPCSVLVARGRPR